MTMTTDLIISMTSWKKRISKVGMVIYTFLKLPPVCNFKVVLVLSSDEFPMRERELPSDLLRLKKHPRFELLWCKDNTGPYKKYFPTREKYPNIPIVAVDDDSFAKPNFLETIWSMHIKDTNRIVYGCNGIPYQHKGIDCVRYGVALFPPDSLYSLGMSFGKQAFGDMDDEYFRLLHVLAGTKYYALNAHDVLHVNIINQSSALGKALGDQWKQIPSMWSRLFTRMPKLKQLWDNNVNIDNG